MRKLSPVENMRQETVEDCVQVLVGMDDRRNEWVSGTVRERRPGGEGFVLRGMGCGPTSLTGCVKVWVSLEVESLRRMDKLSLW